MYSRLLRRYLEHKYKNIEKADRKYETLVKLLDNFVHVKTNQRMILVQLDRTQIPDICIELYDI